MPIQQSSYAIPREDLGEAFHEFDASEEGFIATDVLPAREVQKKAASLTVITRENQKLADDRHVNGAAFNRISLVTEDMDYKCVDRGLEEPLTDEDRENYATDFDAEEETVSHVRNTLLLKREVRAAAAVFDTAVWTGEALYTDNSSKPWDDATKLIIAQVQAAKEKVRQNTGVTPDSMVIGAVPLNNILKNDGIIARFPGATLITEEMLRASLGSIFGLKNLFVGGKTYDSAAEGQDFTAADIWGDDYALVFKQQVGSTRSGGLGRTVIWDRMATEKPSVIQYREEQIDSDVFRGRFYEVIKIFDAYFGHLMKIDADA